VLFEAGLLNTPAFVLNFTGRQIQDFWTSEGYHLVDSADALKTDIERVLTDETFKQSLLDSQPGFGPQYAMNGDGGATERVVNLLLEFVD